jgi:hypothetical protein
MSDVILQPVLTDTQPIEDTTPGRTVGSETPKFDITDILEAEGWERTTSYSIVDGEIHDVTASAIGEKALATVEQPSQEGLFGRLRRIRHDLGSVAVRIGWPLDLIVKPPRTNKTNVWEDRTYRDVHGKVIRGDDIYKGPQPSREKVVEELSLARKLALAVGSPAAFDIIDAHLVDPVVAQRALARMHKTGKDISPAEVGVYLRALDDELQARKRDGFLGNIIYDPADNEGMSIITRSLTLVDQVSEARSEYDVLTSRKSRKASAPERSIGRQSLAEYLAANAAATSPNIVHVAPQGRQEYQPAHGRPVLELLDSDVSRRQSRATRSHAVHSPRAQRGAPLRWAAGQHDTGGTPNRRHPETARPGGQTRRVRAHRFTDNGSHKPRHER